MCGGENCRGKQHHEYEFQFLIVLGTASLLLLLRIQGKQNVRSETSVSDAKKLPM